MARRSLAELRGIEASDVMRRFEREAQENAELAQVLARSRGTLGRFTIPEYPRGTMDTEFRPTARDARVSERWHATATRCIGVAPGDHSATEPTVRVTHADGTSEIRTVRSFRKSRGGRVRTAPQVVGSGERHITAADLAPLGDSNH